MKYHPIFVCGICGVEPGPAHEHDTKYWVKREVYEKRRSLWNRVVCYFKGHQFAYTDLIGRKHPDGDVTWPCRRCGRVFKAPCGLDILQRGHVVNERKT